MNASLHFEGLFYIVINKASEKHTTNALDDEKGACTNWECDNESVRHLLIGFISNDLVKQSKHLTSVNDIHDQVIEKYNASTMSNLIKALNNMLTMKCLKRLRLMTTLTR